ncbi:PhzF family phenazine biosynthesis protein [Mycobacterium sp. 1274756.6]|uniref:PhzF family phenazine biosynthesis protein n=1 Tax=Mycobacterium sp. 1274756.6 TaxID=1834076 RepID=UPI0008004ED4|nr:PhzF family phenazine biosynthesis protein [Mycobacterium sp. 1274756.6]OBJ71385.1 hypothetical protein A5643_08015 [Mycobacterium sp. 1274756.6]
MSLRVAVLRVFTDAAGEYGNPLGVVDAEAVHPQDRPRLAALLGYSETVFVIAPQPGARTAQARIYTPGGEIDFAGHPCVGLAWWLRQRGTPVEALAVPAGLVRVEQAGEHTAITARADWAPPFELTELESVAALTAALPAQYPATVAHYLWAWDRPAEGRVRARMFAPNLGVAEDEATGSAALRLTDRLGRDLAVVQGRGSVIETRWSADGWLSVTGRVVDEGTMTVV